MKQILKQTETQAIVKFSGTNTSDTLTLSTDLLSSTMIVQGTPTVTLIGVTWFCSSGNTDSVNITRNGVSVMNLFQNGQFDLSQNNGISDNTNATSDIVVTISGTGGCYLVLRKVTGYKSKIEPETYGSYDNTAAVGS